jgi:protease IV
MLQTDLTAVARRHNINHRAIFEEIMKIPWFGKKRANRIAVTKIEGVITDSPFTSSSRARVVQSLKLAEELKVRAVVLRINSPGGTVGASQEIYEAVKRLREKSIPVVASFGDVAASGGVYVALAADKIISNPGTITGSIGVIIKSNNLSQLYHKVGVSAQVIKSGEFKDILSNHRPLTDEEKHLLQDLIDDTYEQFVEAVAAGRGLPLATVRSFADGRILSGRQAHRLKLVDELGDLQKAIDVAKELAGIEGKPSLVNLTPAKTWRQRLLGPFAQSADDWQMRLELQGVPLWLMP